MREPIIRSKRTLKVGDIAGVTWEPMKPGIVSLLPNKVGEVVDINTMYITLLIDGTKTYIHPESVFVVYPDGYPTP